MQNDQAQPYQAILLSKTVDGPAIVDLVPALDLSFPETSAISLAIRSGAGLAVLLHLYRDVTLPQQFNGLQRGRVNAAKIALPITAGSCRHSPAQAATHGLMARIPWHPRRAL